MSFIGSPPQPCLRPALLSQACAVGSRLPCRLSRRRARWRGVPPVLNTATQAVEATPETESALSKGYGKEAGQLSFVQRTPPQQLATSVRLAFALPWRRFKKGSWLHLELKGEISEKRQGRFGEATSLPQISNALRNAAHDPRVAGLYLQLAPLSVGWAKLQELRRYLDFFRQSGKPMLAWFANAGEKEYYLASACAGDRAEIFLPPSGSLALKGFAVQGAFLRGVLDKVGVEPQVQRIGKYKSAGDQFLRSGMADAQREQLDAILQDTHAGFVAGVAAARGRDPAEVAALLEEAPIEIERYVEGGWVTGLKYEDEVLDLLRERTCYRDKAKDWQKAQTDAGTRKKDPWLVPLRKYAAVSPRAFGLLGKKRVAVVRAGGAVLQEARGPLGAASKSITVQKTVERLRRVANTKQFAGCIVRVDSPGGDALASDLIWREIKALRQKKPVIATIGDVGASGGYYIAMAASKIVAEPLTITGSIGVVLAKFNLEQLFKRVGFAREVLSKGRYAELLTDYRPFTPDEAAYFEALAAHAYEEFRDKAAASRGLSPDAMQAVAQGRVWSGSRALEAGLVDALGGVARAGELMAEALGLGSGEALTLAELDREDSNPLASLAGGASLGLGAALQTLWLVGRAAMGDSSPLLAALSALSGGAAAAPVPHEAACLQALLDGRPLALMGPFKVTGSLRQPDLDEW